MNSILLSIQDDEDDEYSDSNSSSNNNSSDSDSEILTITRKHAGVSRLSTISREHLLIQKYIQSVWFITQIPVASDDYILMIADLIAGYINVINISKYVRFVIDSEFDKSLVRFVRQSSLHLYPPKYSSLDFDT